MSDVTSLTAKHAELSLGIIFSCDCVPIDGVWIDYWIY
jgi:hypothetical protein